MAKRARQNQSGSTVKGVANEGWMRARHAQTFSSAADPHTPLPLKKVALKTVLRRELDSH